MLNLLKQLGSAGRSQDATFLLSEDLVLVEQRVEPTKKAAQIVSKKLSACLQGQLGLDVERRLKKLPLMMLSISMADTLKDFNPDSCIKKVLEMCCFMESILAKTLADFEVQLEKEVLEPLNKLSEEDLPEILRSKKQFVRLTMEWHNARSRAQTSNGPQAKQEGLREEVEEAWRRLENIKDRYSADLYHFATKENAYANYYIRLLELQVGYHKTALSFLETNVRELKESHRKTEPQLGSPSGKVYGAPLVSHLTESGKKIAVPIQECVHMLLHKGMKEEGLFRLAAAASVVKKLKNSLDHGNVDHSEFSTDPHAVAGALKSYLRELPEPLMTFELYSEWFTAAGEKELPERLEQLKGVLKKLPRENYNNLRYLLQFLAHLSKQQAVNRMTPSNIAIVLGPNLLWPRTESGGESLLDMATASSVQVVTVIEPLIQYAQSLFPEAEDFEVLELPAALDMKESPCQSLKPKTEDSTTASLSSPSTCSEGSTAFVEGTRQALPKSTSGANCTISWENPFGPAIKSPASAQNSAPNQGQNQKMEPGQSKDSCLSASTSDQPTSPSGIIISIHEDRCAYQQHHSSSVSSDQQKGVSGLSKPSTPTPPLAQLAAPKLQPQPRKSLNRKPVSKKGAIRPPNFPPPQPPPLMSRQVPHPTQ